MQTGNAVRPPRALDSALVSFAFHAFILFLIVWLPGRIRPVPDAEQPDSAVKIVPFELIPEVRIPAPPPPPMKPQAPDSGRPEGQSGGAFVPPPAGTAADRKPPGQKPDPAAAPRSDAGQAPPTSTPSGDNGRVASPIGTREPDDSAEPEHSSGFDVNRALRDFRRSSATPRPSTGEPRAEAGGRGLGSLEGLSIPELPPLPDTGFGFGNLQFESRDYDWNDYARQIYIAIWRAWHNRLLLTVNAFEKWGYQSRIVVINHNTRVRFRIEASGQVSDVALERSSRCEPLDESALDALREVVLPPLPDDFPRARETVHATFLAYGEIQAMRPTLRYLQSRGYF